MTTLVNGGRQRIPLDRIAIGDNVRELDADHVDALAASIELRGLVVPVIVRPAGDDYQLVAGYHRSPRTRSSARPTSTRRSATSTASTPTGRSRTSPVSSSTPTNRARLRWMHHWAGRVMRSGCWVRAIRGSRLAVERSRDSACIRGFRWGVSGSDATLLQ